MIGMTIISGTVPVIAFFFHINEYTLGWAVNAILMDCGIGALLAGVSAEKSGRRFVLILTYTFLITITDIGPAGPLLYIPYYTLSFLYPY